MISKKGIFGARNCFGHFLDLGGFIKKTKNTTEIGKNCESWQLPKTHPSFRNWDCWNACLRGVTIYDTQNCVLLKTRFLQCSQQKQQLQKKGYQLHRNRIYTKNSGHLFKMAKGVFSPSLFVIFFFLSFVFVVLVLFLQRDK